MNSLFYNIVSVYITSLYTLYIVYILQRCNPSYPFFIRTFVECQDVKAVVSIGCCYNLLSEESIRDGGSQCGFPMGQAVKSTGVSLGKCARDLACQVNDLFGSPLLPLLNLLAS